MIEALREATRAHRTQASSCSLLGGWLALLHVPAHFLRPTKRGTQTLLHSFKKPCKRSACVARAQRRSAYLRSLLAHGALVLSDARVLLRFCVSEWRKYNGGVGEGDRVPGGANHVLALGVLTLYFSPCSGWISNSNILQRIYRYDFGSVGRAVRTRNP